MSLTSLTENLISDLQFGNLKRNSLIQYYLHIKRNFEEIDEFIDYDDYKKCALLLGILLEVDGYLTDPDERQAVATVSYYIVTKGLFKEVYDENRMGIANPGMPFELTELLGARLSIMNDAPQSLKYSLTSSGTVPIDTNWSPYSGSNSSDKTFDKMKIYDAYLIDDRSRGSYGLFINPECIKMSREILQNYSHYSGAELNDFVMQGYKNHKDFFEYLEKRFERDRDFDFS